MTGTYANAFSLDPGRCFRFVYSESTTQPTECPGAVTARGDFIDGAGQRHHGVEACAEHESDLVPPRVHLKIPG